MNKPKIIFLDWNKTLSSTRFWEQLSDPTHELNQLFTKIESVLFNKDYNIVNPWMLGKITSEEVCKFISQKIGVEHSVLQKELKRSCVNMKFINDNVTKILRQLKMQGVVLVIATDNMDTFSKYTYPTINKYSLFDGYLNSYDIGCFKYDFLDNRLPFFDSYLHTHGYSYNDVVLIDDSLEKVGNFERLGFKIINVNDSFPVDKALAKYT